PASTLSYTLSLHDALPIFFVLMLRWRRCIIADRRDKGETVTIHDSWLYAAAAVFGLALGDHHVTVGLTLPALAVIVYRTQGLRRSEEHTSELQSRFDLVCR